MVEPEYETTTQLAKRVGRDPVTVWNWITRGVTVNGVTVKLAARRIGRQWAIAPDEYQQFLKACNPEAPVLPESPAAERRRAAREVERVRRKLGG